MGIADVAREGETSELLNWEKSVHNEESKANKHQCIMLITLEVWIIYLDTFDCTPTTLLLN